MIGAAGGLAPAMRHEILLPLPPDGEQDRRLMLFRSSGSDFTDAGSRCWRTAGGAHDQSLGASKSVFSIGGKPSSSTLLRQHESGRPAETFAALRLEQPRAH
jgi:hypothetical protein